MNRLQELHQTGQSIWLDFITRQFIADGKLAKLIAEDGLSGVTSNPTIFQKAIEGGKEYDDAIAKLIGEGKNSAQIFDALSIEDIQRACDAFRSVYDRTQGADGFVSLEVNPHFARDTQGTLAEARRLFAAVKRPNVMIKIPGTQEGLSAIEQSLGHGININVTLIFSLQRYQEVLDAWLLGLEQLSASGPAAEIGQFGGEFLRQPRGLARGRHAGQAKAGGLRSASLKSGDRQCAPGVRDVPEGEKQRALQGAGSQRRARTAPAVGVDEYEKS